MLTVIAFCSFTHMPGVRTQPRFDPAVATVAQINAAFQAGSLSSEQLVRLSLARIRAYDPTLHAMLAINPTAIAEAKALDAERRSKGPRSALHGVPILLKDNIDTHDMPTTLGFYGFRGALPYADATVVRRLRAAGAIILGKTNLSELASGPPLSSMGGQTRNPNALEFSPAGSSNGTAVGVAAGYAPVGIATDTTGSARWPAATNGVVGMRPTTGAISYAGIQPNAPTLDSVGAISRHVEDAGLVLAVLEGDSPPRLDPVALRGARVGFPRVEFSGDDPAVDAAMTAAIAALKAAGATVIDVDLPVGLIDLSDRLQATIVQTEAVPSLDGYLSSAFPPRFPRSHAEITALSQKLVDAPMPGATPNPGRLSGYKWEAGAPPLTDAGYQAAKTEGRQYLRAALRSVFLDHHLDALVYPTQTIRINRLGEDPRRDARGRFGNFGPVLASLAGWPDISIPAGATADGLPFGISLLGQENSDRQLLNYAYAFEQRVGASKLPVAAPELSERRIERKRETK
ncbi:amidase [Sphingomonas crusticola]|uniref:amidase n=1 Tax=Sphingomonas crusticola TaxID=1697973 RepID=UPI000E26E162|nr:amidase family protein [Sphingomonas crusticola]